MSRVDHTWDPDPDRVARIAIELADRVRDEDPARLFAELCNLTEFHPMKAAQLLMALAAFFNPAEGTVALVQRVEGITEARVARAVAS